MNTRTLQISCFISVFLFFSTFISAQTEMNPGDLAVVGINATNGGCSGNNTEDIVSFFCFKDFTPGTTIDVTDNGWERVTAGLWGDSEGIIRIERTGSTIVAGTVISFYFTNGVYTCAYPDAGWIFTSLGGSDLNMNSSGGDQLYFMQGGTWNNPVGSQNASYIGGTILFGFNTLTTWAADGTTNQSNLFPGMGCFSMSPSGSTNFIKYTGDTTGTDQKSWINRINNPSNWSTYANCASYASQNYDFTGGVFLRVTEFFNVEAGNDSTVCESFAAHELGGTPSGGTWSGNGVSGTQFDPYIAGPGTHTVTFTYDDAGCLYTDTKVVTVIGSPSAAWSNPDTLCPMAGLTDLNTFVTGTPGGSWSGSGVTGSVLDPGSVLGDITITYSVTDTPCSDLEAHVITVIVNPVASWTSFDSVCEAGGPVNLNPLITGDIGGVWSGTGITNSIFYPAGLAGSYNLSYSVGSTPCQLTNSHSINVNTIPVSAITPVPPEICASSNLNLNGNPVAGTGAIVSQIWSGDTNPLSATNISNPIFLTSVVGNYNLTYTLTDDNGCSFNESIEVTVNPLPSIAISDSSNVSCNGANDAFVDLTTSGGTIPFGFIWSSGQTTEDISGLDGGLYVVTITDDNGCKDFFSVSIAEPAPLVATAAGSNISCFGGNDGIATVDVTGGTQPYSYQWTGTETNDSIFSLIVGLYSVTVTDANNCVSSDNITLTEPLILSSSVVATDVSCHGLNDGAANLIVLGGQTPYAFSWSNTETTQNITNLFADTFYVSITDFNGCKLFDTVIITQPDTLSGIITSTNIACSGENEGTADITVSGGTTPYIYSWTPSGGAGSAASDLVAGVYLINVTDGHNCIYTSSVEITEPPLLQSAIIFESDALCYGNADGFLIATTAGGTLPYSINWSNGDTTTTADSLPLGTYFLTVTDSNGCQSIIQGNVSQPDSLEVTITTTDVSCFGFNDGGAIASVQGGSPIYSYGWDPFSSNDNVTQLVVGAYSMTVTDANGCISINSYIIYEPLILSFATIVSHVSCNGDSTGSINLIVSGGTLPLSYLWSNGAVTEDLTYLPAGNYYFTINDASTCNQTGNITINEPTNLEVIISTNDANCDQTDGDASASVSGGIGPYTYLWSDLQTTAAALNLFAGLYQLTITDNNSCTLITSAIVNNITTLQAVASNVSNASCFEVCDGIAVVSPSAGTPPYTVLWSNYATTENISDLCAGTYIVTVTDNVGCKTIENVAISEPDELVVALSPVDVKCFGESTGLINTVASGGTTPYSYLWSNDSTSANLTNQPSGLYWVTVTDANSCHTSVSAPIGQKPLLDVSVSTTFANCGDNNGEATVTVSGGQSPYVYFWSDGQTTATAINLAAGQYEITVTDSVLCTKYDTAIINNLSNLTDSLESLTNPSCSGFCNGEATIVAYTGNPPYTYHWSDGQTSSTVVGLCDGNYSYTIGDVTGCEVFGVITLTQPSMLDASIDGTNPDCYGDTNGSMQVTVSGGSSPYIYLWSQGSTSQLINNVPAGSYGVIVTDSKGCSKSDSYILTVPSQISLSIDSTGISCFGQDDGALELTVSGGTPPFSILWHTGSSATTLENLSLGYYTVTVTDDNECDLSATFHVSEPAELVVSGVNSNPTCNEASDGSINVTVGGGSIPYSFLWSNLTTENALTNIESGRYTVSVTDGNLCVTTYTSELDIPGISCYDSLQIPLALTPNGDGYNDTWGILGIEQFDNVSVEIYNRWGHLLFLFEGSGVEYTDKANQWDGTFKKKDSPTGSYAYIINLNNGEPAHTGAVAIIR